MHSSEKNKLMSAAGAQDRPIVGITADIAADTGRVHVGGAYSSMIVRAGGTPIILPPLPACVDDFLRVCDAVVLTGGDDPIMTRWNIAMHPKATPLHPQRQEFELALLEALDRDREKPVLGVCLGMQLMGLHRGGTLDQHLPDNLPTASLHWDRGAHDISGELGAGAVHSHHRQALTDAGALAVIARAPDGVIEAIADASRPALYLGVQWHPERTEDRSLGIGLFEQLVAAAASGGGGRGGGGGRSRAGAR